MGWAMIDLHGISQAAFDLIVNSEVSSRRTYENDYRRPERPGGQSGITVGSVMTADIRQQL